MEIVNSSIITVNDLATVDTKIAEVEQLIQQRTDETKSKLSKATAFEDTQAMAAVSKIIDQIASVEASDAEVAMSTLEQLASDHPGLQVVQELTSLFESKRQIERNSVYLEKAEAIEDKIASLDTGSIKGYESVAELLNHLPDEEASPQLAADVKLSLNDALNDKILAYKEELLTQLKAVLAKIDWMGSEFRSESLTAEVLVQLNSLVAVLVSLQAINHTPVYPETWWALDVLLEPYVHRFNFHFNTPRETNKLSKPEWALNFMEENVSKNTKLFELVINQAFKPLKLVMIHQVITSCLVPVRAKMVNMVTILNEKITDFKVKGQTANYEKSGRILSHLIYELTSFDQRLRTAYKYNPFVESLDTVPHKKWMGVTADVLLQGDKERTGTTNWLNFESSLANERFKTEIIEDKAAMRIDTDYKASDLDDEQNTPAPTVIKPTYSALNMVKLFNNLTTHYSTMRMVKFQLKYVSTIQLKLLENYHDYLRTQLKTFDDKHNTSNVLNIIPGTMEAPKQDNSSDSMKGFEMLTGIFCSAQFIHSHLSQWSEELIFIQLWNAYRAVTQKKYDQDATIFDTNFEQYNSLIADVRTRFSSFFKKGLRNYLKVYINTSQWAIQEVKDNSSEFVALISQLPVYLKYLRRHIALSDYFVIVNDIITSICSLWYEYIITNNGFTKKGGEQLQRDFVLLLGQLEDELLLANTGPFCTNKNYGYVKIRQSIELLQKYDAVLAKSMVKRFQPQHIRDEFEHGLSNLNDEEVKELLYRIL